MPFFLFFFFKSVSLTTACLQPATTYQGISFILEYEYPASQLKPYAKLIKESGIFEEALTDLDALFKLPVTFLFSERLTFAIPL